ncbi:MAG: hypothetical protein AABX89_01530 [Candidatus Thermoplasmatota archaeon]|mgnify:CR=1 FL=1
MRVQGALAIVAVALLVALAPVGATSHGTVSLVTDPADDQVVAPNPCLSTNQPAFEGADLLGITLSLVGDVAGPTLQDVYTLTIATTAAIPESQVTTLSFQLSKGPTSLPTSAADGAVRTLTFQGTAPPGGKGRVNTGPSGLSYSFEASDLGAVGGDLLHNVSAATSDLDEGALPAPLTQDDCTGSDRAPDSGAAGTFTFARPPVAGTLTLRLLGGTATLSSGPVSFSGTTLELAEPPQSLRLDLAVTNSGLDADRVELRLGGATQTLQLAAGASENVALATNQTFPTGATTLTVMATSTLGGTAQSRLTLTVAPPTPTAEREVKPAGLAFLSPVATGLAFDNAFGSYAELALLLLLVLLIVAALFLAVTLTRPWVRAHTDVGHVEAPPGATARVELVVDRLKRGVERARAVLRSSDWPATLSGGDGERGVELGLDGSTTLEVRIPHGAAPKERARFELDLVPIAADGSERPDRAAHANVTVQAGLPTTPLGPGYVVAGIQLAGVEHEPSRPRPGETVTTTATVRNGGSSPAPLRVALLVDGAPRAEARIQVPARSATLVPLTWVAGAGANQVKVQVFLA